jgi:alkaline phosphatase D
MPTLDRRQFLKLAAAMGATLAWSCSTLRPSSSGWRERRELFPHGVASGDPDANSVLLWTRRPYDDGRERAALLVEVAQDPGFLRVIATTTAPVLAAADWTCRVLVGDLPPAGEYWYRCVDEEGNGSRIGRTMTAPAPDDPRPARFAFVSCQSLPEGAMNAYRRMIHEDERAAPGERLGFVLHLGDFVYEVIQTPEQVKDGHRYDRRITFPVKYAHGKAVANNRFTVPTTLEDYRALYQGYLLDPDLQDARARFPFVCIWDNHEFSWLAWQSIQEFPGEGQFPAQTLKVAANQAWFEYQPMRVTPPGRSLERFDAPKVVDTPVTEFDDHGLGLEPNNIAAIESLIAYRALRWGRHIDLIITDQRSFRGKDPSNQSELGALFEGVPYPFFPEALSMQVDGGRAYANGHPPEKIVFGARSIPNYRASEPPQSMLGAKQKAWFLERLRSATATWKIWGSSLGTPDWRVDPQHLPDGFLPKDWPEWTDGYAVMNNGDWGGVYHERGEIFDTVRDAGITGFAIVSGDRHSFWAGYAAKALPPAKFEPVGVTFVGASISSPGMQEAQEHGRKDNPLRALYIADRADGSMEPTANLMLNHGVRSALEYARSGDLAKAHAAGNPEMAPHLTFVDVGGHGYATVRVDADTMVTEFVCIPRPIERSPGPDGGPLRYRVRHEVPLWRAGESPRMRQSVVEGDAGLAV